MVEKSPQRAKNQNFEKQKIAGYFCHDPRSIMPKK